MTRIALVIGQLGLGGAEKQLCQLAVGLPNWNYEPYVVALSTGGKREKDLREKGIQTFVLSRDRSLSVKRLLQTVALLRRIKPDIVYGFDYAGSIYGKLAGIIAGVPILIGGVRSGWLPPRKVLYMERFLRRRTDAVISNSFAGKQTWVNLIGYPEKKIAVVHNGFSIEDMKQPLVNYRSIRELLQLPNNASIVGCISSIYDLKNPLMFVEVAAAVIPSMDGAHFVWIGDGPMRQDVELAIAKYGMEGRVHLLGSRDDASWLARDFQIGILTSLVEGTPNAVMEYMFWGVPVVATDAGDCKELIEHERTGFIVEKNDFLSMARYIYQLLQSPTTAHSLGQRGREKLANEFSMDTMLVKTVEVCEKAEMRSSRIKSVGVRR